MTDADRLADVPTECQEAATACLAALAKYSLTMDGVYRDWAYWTQHRYVPAWWKLLTADQWRSFTRFGERKGRIAETNRRNHEELNRPRPTDRWPAGKASTAQQGEG